MKKLALALVAFGLLGSTAQAASLSNKTYSTAQAAAKAGAAYAFSKAVGGGRFHAHDMRITGTVSKTASTLKFRVTSAGSSRSKIVTVKKDGPGQYRAFLPNRKVFTPGNAYRN